MGEGIHVFGQNCIRIETAAGVVYTDPFRMTEEPHDADFVLITHDHYDHFSPEDLAKVCKKSTVLVVPERMAEKAQEVSGLVGKTVTVRYGSSYSVCGLNFETVRSYNIGKPFHPKDAEWVGYIIEADAGRVYVAGDSDATEEAKAVRCDVALIPIGGKYTTDAEEGAELANIIKPKLAIPVHYFNPEAAETFTKLLNPEIRTEIPF